MSGLLFLVSVVAIGVVAAWAYANDRAGPAGGTLGLLAMRGVDEAPPVNGPDPPRWRGGDGAAWEPRAYSL